MKFKLVFMFFLVGLISSVSGKVILQENVSINQPGSSSTIVFDQRAEVENLTVRESSIGFQNYNYSVEEGSRVSIHQLLLQEPGKVHLVNQTTSDSNFTFRFSGIQVSGREELEYWRDGEKVEELNASKGYIVKSLNGGDQSFHGLVRRFNMEMAITIPFMLLGFLSVFIAYVFGEQAIAQKIFFIGAGWLMGIMGMVAVINVSGANGYDGVQRLAEGVIYFMIPALFGWLVFIIAKTFTDIGSKIFPRIG